MVSSKVRELIVSSEVRELMIFKVRELMVNKQSLRDIRMEGSHVHLNLPVNADI
jgi:hypothetical protein